MSEDNRFKGKLKQLHQQENESFDDLCKRISNGEDDFFNDNYEKYVLINDKLFEIVECEELDAYDNFCYLYSNEDNTISFLTQYYNGGTCLSEMLESELKKL